MVVVVEEERAAVNDETDMLESLTGLPVPEDEILFAVPVCAPYATLLNYKFKGTFAGPKHRTGPCRRDCWQKKKLWMGVKKRSFRKLSDGLL